MTTNTITNPVLTAEFRHQRFVIQNSRNGWIWILLAILMIAPAFILTVGYTVGLLTGWLVVPNWYAIPQSWHWGAYLLLVTVMVSLYIVVTLVTMALANSSIRREKDKHTWGLLRLTEVKSEQIVWGKWWASLWALNGDNVMVILLRMGVLAMVCGVYLPAYHASINQSAPYRLYFLILLPILALQAAIDTGFSAILGIASAVPDDALGTVTRYIASMLRLMLSLLLGYWFYEVLIRLVDAPVSSFLLALIGLCVSFICLLLGFIAAKLLVDRS